MGSKSAVSAASFLLAVLVLATVLVWSAVTLIRETQTSTNTSRYHNGAIKAVETLDCRGHYHGVCLYYFENGGLEREAIYNHGAILLFRNYFQNGLVSDEMWEGDDHQLKFREFPNHAQD